MESAGAKWAQDARWRGGRLPRPHLTKGNEKEKDHSPEESYVVTKEFFLVKGWKENTSCKPGAVEKTTSGDSQSSKAKWSRGGKMSRKFSAKQDCVSNKGKRLGTRAAKKAKKERNLS